ncbi:hypothetical protein DBR06_SOUSAS11210029, partial [Sousa chinensis]
PKKPQSKGSSLPSLCRQARGTKEEKSKRSHQRCSLFLIFPLQFSKKCSEIQKTISGKRKSKSDDPEMEHCGRTKRSRKDLMLP